MKELKIGNEEAKVYLVEDDVFPFLKYSTRNLLHLMNTFIKIAGYKLNTEKSVALLYINDKNAKENIKEIMQFIIVSKNTEHFEVNLTKKMKDFSNENFKELWKEIENYNKTCYIYGLVRLRLLKSQNQLTDSTQSPF